MATLEEKLSNLEEYVKQQKSWKERHQHLKTKYDKLSDVHQKLINDYSDLKEATDPARIEKLQQALETQANVSTEIREKAQAFDNLCQALAPLIPKQLAGPLGFEPGIVSQGHDMSMAEIDERINQRLSEAKEIRVVQIDVDQRIKELVKSSYVQNLEAKIKALPAPAVKAALWMHEKKAAKIGDLYYYMYEKAGRIPGNFYANVVNPLQDAWLIVNEAGNVRWTLEERLTSELKDVLRNGDVQDLAKYLTSLLL